MPKIIVYNNDTDRMEVYYRDLSESMPYNLYGTLTVREFRGASRSDTLSVYVLIAQDDLNTLGYPTGGLDRNIWKQNI